jgi:SAM-dependent methyltransferase
MRKKSPPPAPGTQPLEVLGETGHLPREGGGVGTTRDYVFATEFEGETRRMEAGEALWDPGTFDRLDRLGVGPGWSCLEVGAGCGSVAHWLAESVGESGSVVATDVRLDRLQWVGAHGVVVMRHDVATDGLPEAVFDLVHARMVIQHLDDPAAAVERMRRALRPGGWLLLEDTDTSSLFRHATDPTFLQRVKDAAYVVMRRSGHQGRGGLVDLELVRGAGFIDVEAEGRAVVVEGGSELALWYSLWIEHLRPDMLADGLVSEDEIARAMAELGDPANRWLTQVMLAVVGRHPA